MKHKVRVGVAYIVGCLLGDSNTPSSVYDYDNGKYTSISGDVSSSEVNVYDYGMSCYITGNGQNSEYSIYHYGTGKYINLSINKSQGTFNGYDYDSGKHFNGDVKNNSISIYDYDTSKYYRFTI